MRASAVGLVALLLAAVTPDQARATFVYEWLTTSGPTLKASFMVPDSAVLGGTIHGSDMAYPPGFSAVTPVGRFTNLTVSSALAVDPVSGDAYTSASYLTATNETDTLLLSARGYFIPTSPLQSRGKGRWTATYIAGPQPPTQLAFLGFTNGHAQLQVTCLVDMTFSIEASADLLQWQPILTNQVFGGVCTVTDPSLAVAPSRFYRAAGGR